MFTTAIKFRLGAAFVVLAMALAMVLPMLQSTSIVQADQLENRLITLGTSESGLADVTYAFSADTVATGDPSIEGLVLQYCDTSPIIGDATCGDTRSFDWADATLTVNSQSGITDWTVDTTNSTSSKLILSRSGGAASVTTGTTVSFTLGSNSSDGVTNPTGDNDDFFVRALFYATDAAAQAYVVGTPGTTVDDGGIALSTAEQIDIVARVAEAITFTVGADAETDNCTSISGKDIDLGILSSGSINDAVSDSVASNNDLICAEVLTNAVDGVTVTYYGDNLKVSGATCGTVNDDANGASVTDQCLNYDDDPDAGTTTGATVAGTEGWGLAVEETPDNGTTVGVLSAASAYDLDTADEYAFAANTTTTIGSTSAPVDDEALEINVGATSEISTPSGLYQTTLTFVATGQF